MKTRHPLLFLAIFCITVLQATAQPKAYLVLEYMHVKAGNDAAYYATENVWRKIHMQRAKDSTILDWSVWAVTAPFNMNAEYQYVVATVYPSLSAYLDPYKNVDMRKVFTGISEDSINRMLNKTADSRDMLRSSVFEIMYSEGFNGKNHPQYVLATEMKATPRKENAYETLEMKDWRPIHKDLIKNGFESAFNFSRLMFPSDANSSYNYAIFRFYDNGAMMDKQDKADWNKYSKANPLAFSNAGTLRTEVHTELLTRVASLQEEAK